jgi:hypothetical protein
MSGIQSKASYFGQFQCLKKKLKVLVSFFNVFITKKELFSHIRAELFAQQKRNFTSPKIVPSRPKFGQSPV